MYMGTLPPASNRATFERIYEVISVLDNTPLDLSLLTIVYEIADPTTGDTLLSATTANGKITILELGKFSVLFNRDSDMTVLLPGSYRVGCTISDADHTRQFISATLPIIDGVVAI